MNASLSGPSAIKTEKCPLNVPLTGALCSANAAMVDCTCTQQQSAHSSCSSYPSHVGKSLDNRSRTKRALRTYVCFNFPRLDSTAVFIFFVHTSGRRA